MKVGRRWKTDEKGKERPHSATSIEIAYVGRYSHIALKSTSLTAGYFARRQVANPNPNQPDFPTTRLAVAIIQSRLQLA